MADKKFNNEDGVWRTIGGRRVFIKNGQNLADAMKESGKFKTTKSGNVQREDLVTAKAELDKRFIHEQERDLEKAYDTNRYKLGTDYWGDNLNKAKEMENNEQKFIDDYNNPKEYKGDISDIEAKHIDKAQKSANVSNNNEGFEVKVKNKSGKTIATKQFGAEKDADDFINSINTSKYNYVYKETKDAQNYRKELASIRKQLNDGDIDLEEAGAKKEKLERENKFGKMEADYNDQLKERTKREESNNFVKEHLDDLKPDSDEYTKSLNKYLTEHGELGGKQGDFLIYNSDEDEFYKAKLDHDKQYLENKKTNNYAEEKDGKKYASMKSYLASKENNVSQSIRNEAYKKYMKEHPGSKMTFEEFKDMRK